MPWQTIRPSGDPYNLTSGPLYDTASAWFGAVNTLPSPDLGSLSDDADTTYVTLSGYFNEAESRYESTIIAVDFAPVSAIASFFGFMVRMARMFTSDAFAGETWQNTASLVLDSSTGGIVGSFDLVDLVPRVEPSEHQNSIPTDLTTYSAPDLYRWETGTAAAFANGLTVVTVARINAPAPQQALRIAEFGLIVETDVTYVPVPRRRYPLAYRGIGVTRSYPRPSRRSHPRAP